MNKAFLSAVCLILGLVSAGFLAAECTATDGEHLDANYKPEAPMRSSVGSGYVLTGTVRASGDCKPIPGATVELWLAGPGGYGDNYTGTVVADKAGHYRFQSPFPSPSTGRPPHIHMRIAADGFLPIQTECFPRTGTATGVFDIVLEPGG
ncbi:MAG: intradiol ring-cleavage dioxygenase [Spirochaetia bacterium]|jgi:protocatechuate 3,4-dioxygenase beta subunit